MQMICEFIQFIDLVILRFGDQPVPDRSEIQIGFVPHSSSFSDGLEQMGDHSPKCLGCQCQVSRFQVEHCRCAQDIGCLQVLFRCCAACREHI